MSHTKITEACVAFLAALGEDATDNSVFVQLWTAAQTHGLTLCVEQRGVQGSFIHFRRSDDTHVRL